MPKLTIEVTEQLDAALTELAVKEGLPKSQVVRRSIALFKFLEDQRAAGLKVAIADKNDKVVKEIVTT